MEYVIGDKIQLEMKVDGELLFGGTYKCMNRYPDFTKEDLKPGMVVECRDGVFAAILPFQNGLSTITKDGVALNLCRFTDDLRYPDSYAIDIIKVYGLSENARDMLNFSKEHRELLWERKEPKYKVGDKFFFEELSEIKRQLITQKFKVSLHNVIGEIKKVEDESELFKTSYRIEFQGYKEEDIGIALFDDYILDNYGKKINC